MKEIRMANENNRLVVAYFPNAGAAEATAQDLKEWDDANDSIKLGAIAVLTLNNQGEIHADEVGERSTKSGAMWGTAIGGVIGILTGGIGLIPALLVGAGGGALIGALNHKSVGITDAEREDIVQHLRDGAVALAIMADDFEVDATMAKMVELGGRADYYEIPLSTTNVVNSTVEAQNAAVAAVDEAAETATKVADDVKRAVTVDLPNLPAAAAAAVTGLAAGIDINTADAARLQAAGVEKVSSLYKLAATPQGRAELAKTTGLSAEAILVMEKKLDLMRIKGIGPKYATLLVASGIDSVAELAGRNPANLLGTMTEVNAAQHIVDALPSEADVAGWVAQAKALPKVVVF
jgi:uncharacterized membrane protein/predicted flap endonuclease-1-like 5' DNA nuclease